jgi:hypothetical protein
MILARCTFAILAVSAGISTSFAATTPKIAPLQTRMTFSAHSEGRRSVPIRSSDGSTSYILSLEPDFDVGHHVVTLELVLRHFGDKVDGPNLFDPTGPRHGLQAYDFAADDLAQGGPKSVFGRKRVLRLDDLGLVVRIIISGAVVHPVSAGNYQIDSVDLEIEVDNSNP